VAQYAILKTTKKRKYPPILNSSIFLTDCSVLFECLRSRKADCKKAARTKQRQETSQISRALIPEDAGTEEAVLRRRLGRTRRGTRTTDSRARGSSTGRTNVIQEIQTSRPEGR